MLSLTLVGPSAGKPGADTKTMVEVVSGQASFTIGRDPACDWVLADRSLAVSARHCEVLRTPQGVLLRDHSTNGTFVNGANHRMPAEHALRDGDRIEVGPYVIEVRMKGELVAVDAALPPAMPPASAAPSVEDTAPMVNRPARGQDPAAVAAAAVASLPSEDNDLTRIRPAPPAAPKSPVPPVTPALPTPVRQAPSQAATTPADESFAQALAQALGLPPESLAGQAPERLLAQVGALTRAAVDGLRRLQAEQAEAQRAVGSRRRADWRAGSSLRLPGSTDEALVALLTAGDPAALSTAVDALVDHQARLAAAPRAALKRLGEELAPAHLAAGLPAPDPAQQWALYGRLWQHLDGGWSEGFAAAGWLHLAAAYDQDSPGA